LFNEFSENPMIRISKSSGLRALALATVLGAFAAAGSAGAATLDFTDRNQWSGSGGSATSAVDYGWFTAALATSPGASANFNENFDGPQSSGYCQANGGPLACQGDGLGLVDDEITTGQSVTVSFSRALRVTGLHFLDLFRAPRGDGYERASIYLNGDSTAAYHFDALEVLGASSGVAGDTRSLGGYLFADVDFRNVFSLTFFAPEGFADNRDNDYALAGIEVTLVPLPAGGWLLLAALGGLALASRRRRNRPDT
jgi:hypothetical protein